MNMPVKLQYFKNPKNRELTQSELDELARELDAIKQEVLDDLGEKDAKYIRRVYSSIRYSSIAGRALLFAGWFPPAWLLGTGLLGFAKIMENMELGHNVMHGQYDWMNDPLKVWMMILVMACCVYSLSNAGNQAIYYSQFTVFHFACYSSGA